MASGAVPSRELAGGATAELTGFAAAPAFAPAGFAPAGFASASAPAPASGAASGAVVLASVPAASGLNPLAGSEQIAALQRDIRRLLAQVEATQARVVTLTPPRDRTAAAYARAKALKARVSADLTQAGKDAKSSAKRITSAKKARKSAKVAATKARARYTKAAATMSAIQVRVDRAAAASASVAKSLAKAEKGVKKALKKSSGGSEAQRKALTAWRMLAVADRAAHARAALLEDPAADAFVAMKTADAAVTHTSFSYSEAIAELTSRRAQAASATARVKALTAQRSAAKTQVKATKKSAKAAREALDGAVAERTSLNKRITVLQAQVTRLEETLAGGLR